MEGNIFESEEWKEDQRKTDAILNYQIKTHKMLEEALGLNKYPDSKKSKLSFGTPDETMDAHDYEPEKESEDMEEYQFNKHSEERGDMEDMAKDNFLGK